MTSPVISVVAASVLLMHVIDFIHHWEKTRKAMA